MFMRHIRYSLASAGYSIWHAMNVASVAQQQYSLSTVTYTATKISDTGTMAAPGCVQIYDGEIIGIGSYGKVCKAKYGQLPCAAKLFHSTLFQNNGPGTRKLVKKFL